MKNYKKILFQSHVLHLNFLIHIDSRLYFSVGLNQLIWTIGDSDKDF